MVKVTLVNWTPQPIKTVMWAFLNMHNKIPDSLDKLKISEKEQKRFYEMLMTQPHQTVLEFVNMVWLIEGGSRAFQTQLVRTRDAAYSIQSLRVVKAENFYDNEAFTESEAVKKNLEVHKRYHETMLWLQHTYQKLIELGCPTEDARGILPLNVHSPITMSINLRALYHMMELRFCDNTQEEYREVAKQMRDEIRKKMSPIIAKYMMPICLRVGYCPSPFPCKKYPKIEKRVKIDVSDWLKG